MDGTLKYYMLDWDDNILKMPTKIILKGGPVSTDDFAKIPEQERTQHLLPNDESFEHFRNDADFESDLESALKDLEYTKRPSFEPFKKALIEARLFAIVTARGHSPDAFRKGVVRIIEEAFSPDEQAEMIENIQGWRSLAQLEPAEKPLDSYLALDGFNAYYGVTSDAFTHQFHGQLEEAGALEEGSAQPAKRKTIGVDHFVEQTLRSTRNFSRPVDAAHFGFSDDDQKNIDTMKAHFEAKTWSAEFPDIDVVFFTYRTTDWQTNDVIVRRFG